MGYGLCMPLPRTSYILMLTGVLAACGDAPQAHNAAPQLTSLRQAVNDCRADPLYAQLRESDRTLVLDGMGASDSDGLGGGTIGCILDSLGAGATLSTRIMSTRPITTIQRGTWTSASGKYTSRWSYTYTAGLMLVVRKV